MVYVNGELWNATSESGSVPAGETAIVTGQDGFRLHVRKD
jgi:membrane protein implicated in regulation of membrane protease activity